MPKTRKIPMRKCTGCGELKPKKELIRVLHTPEDTVEIDRTGKKNGRGAYLCDDTECFKKARKSHAVERSLGVTFSEEIYDRLEKEMSSGD
ncbi:MAG: YlxR family protein [Lachnospiraceae bacterium]|nr:YlxR family protein [Lachnospiraceae bacterium]